MIKTSSKYKSKRTFSWVSDKVVVKDTKKYGIGAYAKEKILKNERVVMFGGHVMTRQEESKTPQEVYDNAIQIDDNLVIGAIKADEVEDGSMFNHSCNANAGVRGQILLVAMRDIEKGEQVTFDFGTVLYRKKGAKPYRLKCLCGEKKCRKVITDNDWKLKNIQQRYKGYFPLHIQDKIDELINAGNPSYSKATVEVRSSRIVLGELGLFTLTNFSKGDIVIKNTAWDESRLVTWDEFKSLNQNTKNKLIHFCYKTKEGIRAPRNINEISIAYFVNHSCDPKLRCDDDYNYVAIKDISIDEELTIDVEKLMDKTIFSFRCNCGSINCRKVIRI